VSDQPTMQYLHCPMRQCDWRTVDRSHLGWVVVGKPAADSSGVDLERQPARDVMHGELLAHLADVHVPELQLMLAGASGGRGEPVTCNVVQHIDARQVQDAADLVASVLVPQMRARLAKELCKRNLRPLDPWPAVQVRRYCWGDYATSALNPPPGVPGGMRAPEAGERPDLYALELSTDAVPDTRMVQL
jgi:hypothetical protein